MIFEGEERFSQDVAQVWRALHDADVLRMAIPGCKSLRAQGNNVFIASLSLGVAAVKGEYEGTVKVSDLKPLSHYSIEGEGKGAPGFVRLRMDCRFDPNEGGALMRWKCDAIVGGVIANVGGKVLSGISKFMAQQFFSALKAELAKGAETQPTQFLAPSGSDTAGPRTLWEWFARLWTAIARKVSRRLVS
jgi:uncharacterized protein